MYIDSNIEKIFDRLWPINRSLMGPGYRESLDILSEVMPMTRHVFKTGDRVFDWTVPREWHATQAYFIDPNGKKHADLSINNLHLLGYSIPFKGKLPLEELKKHLHTLPDMPKAIPYVTSYYNERWGFCISHEELLTLPEGEYEIVIESNLYPGDLLIGESVLIGSSDEEVLFSSYLCHPSMANNELSGPLGLIFLYKLIESLPNRHYTYRFAISAETIGTIAYLSMIGKHLKEKMVAGYQMTCIADSGNFTYKRSRQRESLADKAALQALKESALDYSVVDFEPQDGSDERQYCSPGFNLPHGSLMRTQYGKFKEYHTSLDNKEFISFSSLEKSIQMYFNIVKILESNFKWKNIVEYGEPQLGKRGLYPTLGAPVMHDHVKAMMWLINYADGTNDLIDIAGISGFSTMQLSEIASDLEKHQLFKKA